MPPHLRTAGEPLGNYNESKPHIGDFVSRSGQLQPLSDCPSSLSGATRNWIEHPPEPHEYHSRARAGFFPGAFTLNSCEPLVSDPQLSIFVNFIVFPISDD